MGVNLDKIIAGMFGLILVFLLLTRSAEFNSIIKSAGGFVTDQTRALQGVGYGSQYSLIGGSNASTVGSIISGYTGV